jgi:hypothetical protein
MGRIYIIHLLYDGWMNINKKLKTETYVASVLSKKTQTN